MKPYPLPLNEPQRLLALEKYQVLDTLPEQQFDDLTALAANICQTPMALISLIDKDRQWFKSAVGLSVPETPRDVSFCTHAICDSKMTVIPDAREHEFFKTNSLVTGAPNIRFYAGAPLTTPDGHNIGTLCVIDFKRRDLTEAQLGALSALSRTVISLLENRKMEAAYSKQANFLNAVMTEMPVLVSYIDPTYRYQFANAAYGRSLGFENQNLIGKNVIEVVGPEKFAIGEPYLKKAFRGERVEFEAEVSLVVDGISKSRSVRANYIPDFDSKNKVCGVFTIITDLTSQINAEQEFARKEREVQSVLDALPASISHYNKDLRNIACNDRYAKHFGKTSSTIKGMLLRDVIGPEIFERNRNAIIEVLKGNPQSLEETFNLPEGTKYTLVNLLPDFKNGEVVGYYSIVNDISQIKTLDQEKRRLEGQIIASAKMAALGEMAGGVAHEINTPLGIILGTSEHLRILIESETIDRDLSGNLIAKIEATTERIAKIINGLRTFSRNAENDEKRKMSLRGIIDSTFELCQQRFSNSEVELTLDIPEDVTVMCRPVQVSQILLNLLNNAFDAVIVLNEKWVKVEVKLVQQELIILVSDSGLGISAEIADKIMQPFFTTKDVGKGTGLGLSVSYGLAKANDGQLEYVRGAQNTTFCLKLPLA